MAICILSLTFFLSLLFALFLLGVRTLGLAATICIHKNIHGVSHLLCAFPCYYRGHLWRFVTVYKNVHLSHYIYFCMESRVDSQIITLFFESMVCCTAMKQKKIICSLFSTMMMTMDGKAIYLINKKHFCENTLTHHFDWIFVYSKTKEYAKTNTMPPYYVIKLNVFMYETKTKSKNEINSNTENKNQTQKKKLNQITHSIERVSGTRTKFCTRSSSLCTFVLSHQAFAIHFAMVIFQITVRAKHKTFSRATGASKCGDCYMTTTYTLTILDSSAKP